MVPVETPGETVLTEEPILEETVSEPTNEVPMVEMPLVEETSVVPAETVVETSILPEETVAEETLGDTVEAPTVEVTEVETTVSESEMAEATVEETAVVPTETETEALPPVETAVKINEVESNDPKDGPDWIEIFNNSDQPVDISGCRVADDKGMERLEEPSVSNGLPEGTILESGAYYVLSENQEFTFGLGKADVAMLFDQYNRLVDQIEWSCHAPVTFGRETDGTGSPVELTTSTPNATNEVTVIEEELPTTVNTIIINEVDSNPSDWIELLNVDTESMNLGGYEVRDSDDDHRFIIQPDISISANSFYVIDNDTIGLIYDNVTNSYTEGPFSNGLGSSDRVRLYNPQGELVDELVWTTHATTDGDNALATYGRMDGKVDKTILTHPTKGAENQPIMAQIAINEVESNDSNGGPDWVEIYNFGTSAIDITDWYILDDGGQDRLLSQEVTPIAVSTLLNPGETFVFENGVHFSFGLGKADLVTLMDATGSIVDQFSWDGHAEGTYGRLPNGTGEMVDLEMATKNALNTQLNPVVISEVESKDANDGPDWIELYNPLEEALDISGLVIKDNDDSHQYIIPEGTQILPKLYWVVDENSLGFGLSKADSVRIFDGDTLIQEFTWEGHANNTYALRPDTLVMDQSSEPTPNDGNQFAYIPTLAAWDGNQSIVVDGSNLKTFLEDSSGLDFHDGALYAVDNGTATVWKLNVSKEDGSLTVDPQWVGGKKVQFLKDKGNDSAKGPDAEGITLDKDGFIYIASERDNADKNTNYNIIIQVNPNPNPNTTTYLETMKEWNLTALLPEVSANMGIEAVEWVGNEDMVNVIDLNTNQLFDASHYPNMIAEGIFYVALEDNGVVYGFVINEDGTAQKVVEIDSKIGGAMALDFDKHSKLLYVSADDGYENMLATIGFNGTDSPVVSHISRPEGMVVANREGFAIASAEYMKDGLRPVYWFEDGVKEGALTVGAIKTVLTEQSNPEEEKPTDAEEKPSENKGKAETPSKEVKEPKAPTVKEVKTVQKATVQPTLPATGERHLSAIILAVILTTSGLLLVTKKQEN